MPDCADVPAAQVKGKIIGGGQYETGKQARVGGGHGSKRYRGGGNIF